MAEWEDNGERLFLLSFSCFQTPHSQCDPYKTELSADVTFDKASPFFLKGGGGGVKHWARNSLGKQRVKGPFPPRLLRKKVEGPPDRKLLRGRLVFWLFPAAGQVFKKLNGCS